MRRLCLPMRSNAFNMEACKSYCTVQSLCFLKFVQNATPSRLWLKGILIAAGCRMRKFLTDGSGCRPHQTCGESLARRFVKALSPVKMMSAIGAGFRLTGKNSTTESGLRSMFTLNILSRSFMRPMRTMKTLLLLARSVTG